MVTSVLTLHDSAASTLPHGEIATSNVSAGWDLDVDRGPNWLFVRINGADRNAARIRPLAEELRALLEEHLINRIVVEVNVPGLPLRSVFRQLAILAQWLDDHHGVIRLCGQTASCKDALRRCGLSGRIPLYRNRVDAVFGRAWPWKPR